MSTLVSRRMGLLREDEVTLFFCGSRKRLASGVPMARMLFASHAAGMAVLPLMLFHQLRLKVCAMLARRCARNKTVLVPLKR